MNREDIVKELNELQSRISDARTRLDKFDFEEKFNSVSKYLGKYYKEDDELFKTHIRCLYVYEIDEQCIPQSIIVSYFTDTDNYFGIEQYHHFNPDNTYSDDKWVEIDKEEFETHFNIVQDKITKSINSDLKK